jgi:N-acetylneuraminic acid mutarotase
MSTPRAYAIAVLLANGHVLVSGGIRSGRGDGNATAEIYDPDGNRWSLVANNAQIQGGQSLTVLGSGKVLMVGTSQPQLYDPDSDSWSPAGTMAFPRHTHTATLLSDGRVLIAGGFAEIASGGNPQTDTTEIYDPAANGWGRGMPMTATRAFHTATLLNDGRVLVVGGEEATGPYLATTELYDPAANHWTLAGSLSGPRGAHTASLLPDGRVLVTGGWGAGGTYASTEIYVPAPPSTAASTPTPDSGSSTAVSPAATNRALGASPLAASQGTLTRLENIWPFVVAPVLLLLAIISFRFVRRRRRI